jgi:enolase-phosphatase E1
MQPNEILFLSDNVKEVDAALEAGMEACLVDRLGNAPVPDSDRARLDIVESLDEVGVAEDAPHAEDTSEEAEDGASADSASDVGNAG